MRSVLNFFHQISGTKRFYFIIVFYLLASGFGIHNLPSPPLYQNQNALNSGWEYAWGSLEKDLESIEPTNLELKWKPYTIGQSFPGVERINFIWIRNKLPKLDFLNPALYISGVDQNFICFVEDKKIFSMGTIPITARKDFPGFFRYILIPLEKRHSEKTIYFYINSKWVNIGLSQSVLYGKESDLIFYRFLSNDAFLLFLAILCFFLSIVLRFIQISLNKKSLVHISGLYFFVSLVFIYQTSFSLVFWNYPVFYTLIGQFGITMTEYYLLQTGSRLVFGKERKFVKWFISLYYYFMIYIVAMAYFLPMEQIWHNFIGLPTWILVFLGGLVLVYSIWKGKHYKRKSTAVFLFGLTLLVCSTIPQILYELSLIPIYPNFYFHLGLLSFILSLGYISYIHLHKMYVLAQKSKQSLEKAIQDRTKELEEKQKKIIVLERKMASKETEESILADFHDEIGANILDLKALALQCKTDDKKIKWDELLDKVDQIAIGLKERIYTYEDKELMKENFVFGIKSFLFHRYELHNRRILIKDNEDVSLDSLSDDWKKDFISLVQEISSNDIKYGRNGATSLLSITQNKDSTNNLTIDFTASSNFLTSRREGVGKGSKTIRARVEHWNGKVVESLDSEKYAITIELPVQREAN